MSKSATAAAALPAAVAERRGAATMAAVWRGAGEAEAVAQSAALASKGAAGAVSEAGGAQCSSEGKA